MTFLELAKAALRSESDDDADHALWNRTPFPFDTDPRVLFKRIDGYRRACANGRQLCDFCYRLAVDNWCCESCNRALANARDTGATK